MDSLSPMLDVATRLWDCSSKHVAYIHNLEKNLQKLRTEKDALNRRRDDVRHRVEVAEQNPRMEGTKEVQAWLTSAETMETEVDVIIDEGDQELRNKCVGGCFPKNLKSTYKIGKRISKKIDSVMDLLHKGDSYRSDSAIVVTKTRLPPLMPEWPLENTVGLDSAVERVWSCIVDENVGIIRLCGTGGIGKTTLLEKVRNEFHRQSHDFDAVIWAEVPRQEDYVEKVQEAVRKQLDIPDEVWNRCSGRREKEVQISSFLKGKKFVLLLDNVWEQFGLQRLGIYLRNDHKQSKVIFTARSLELRFDGEVDVTIEVEFLSQEQSLSLFRMTVGESILSSDPNLSELANTLAKRCGGLPLALLTVARAMACRKTLPEWRHTDVMLHTDPWQLANMGAYVLPLLKLSYDSLNDAIAKNCFLYCSIFPEGDNINIDELIDLWIGEGFLDGPNPCDQGEYIVRTLKLAFLLQKGESEQCVRMHDILRHVALWLARDQGKNKDKVLVGESGKNTVSKLTEWEEANWISMFGSRVSIDHSPSCPYLSTLLLRDAQLESFPNGFFDFMPTLKVLDLSGNQGLVKLPSGIGNAKNLQYLNLSSTSIAELPTGLRNFRKLRCLLLDYTMNLKWIPKEVISELLHLQVYSKIDGVMDTKRFASVEVVPCDEVGLLEVLECLNHINKIRITIFSAPSLEKILKSYILRSCIRKLTLMVCTGLVSPYIREDLSNLERFELFHCGSVKEFRVSEQCQLGNLSKVYIAACPKLLNLNFLSYATKLEILTITECESLKEVTIENMAFPGLKTLSLTRLQNLKSICPSPRCFPSLLEIEVSECLCLKQLPFDLESANLLLKIRGETEWWDGLIWDDEAVMDACRLKFVPTSDRLGDDFPFGTESGMFKDGDLLVNEDGVRIVSQSEPEAPPLIKPSETDNDSQLSLEDFDEIEVIGKGNGGIVQLVQHKWTGQFFALKITQMNIEESARKQIARELKINQSSQCPYVVFCYQSFYTNGAISIILEYMDGGSLADFLKKVKSIPEPYLAAICKQVLKGLMYLHHERHIIHRDLKPSNLLINHRGEVKISDFGVSAIMTSTSGRANTFVGTYNYMSPERIIGGDYDNKVDIWSLGLVLLECATGQFPYSPEQAEGWTNFFELMEQIVEEPPPCAHSDQFSPEFCSFVSACLQKDPKKRKYSGELLAMPFLNMYDDLNVDLSSYFTTAGSSCETF